VTISHLSAGGLVAFECRGFNAVGGLSVIDACSTSFVRFDARPRPVVGTRLASNTGRISVRTRIRFGKIGGATGLRRSGPRRSDISHGHSASLPTPPHAILPPFCIFATRHLERRPPCRGSS
jgi:hypothetical protein